MTIISSTFGLLGQDGVTPRRVQLVTTDDLSTITTAGYLTEQGINPAFVYATDIFDVIYSYNTNTGTGTYIEMVPSIVAGVITLTGITGGSTIILPTIANHIATYTNTTGTLSEDPATAISGGNIQAGLSGTLGTLSCFPATPATGSLVIESAENNGDFLWFISNSTLNQQTSFVFPDPNAASAGICVNVQPFTPNNFPQINSTGGVLGDSGIAVNNVLLLDAANTLTGAGSIVLPKVNGTEAANAVTADGVAGIITTSALTTAAGANYAITWTNTKITATSVITLTVQGGTNTTQNITFTCVPGSGTATLTIFNNDPLAALNGTILIGYTVF